jgi:hypothetical protein
MSFQAKMVTDNVITAIVNGKPYQIDVNHPNFELAKKALSENNSEGFVELVNENKGVEVYASSDSVGNSTGITVSDDAVYYKGRKLHNSIVDRILGFKSRGLPVDDLVKFLENLMQNPSSTSIEELYDFLENKNLPITENGTFIGYKAVDSEYWSITGGSTLLNKGTVNDQGKIFNGVGEEIVCERNEVDDDRRNECSYGLHVGGLNYAVNVFARSDSKVVLVEVNPKDVVSVPQDYGSQKLRTCAYKVIGEYEKPLDDYSTREVEDQVEDYDYDEFEDEEFLTFKDLEVGMDITFFYNDDYSEARYCEVFRVDPDGIVGKLDYLDPSSTGLDVPEYRKFLWKNMTEVEQM